MKKQIKPIILILFLIFSLSACGKRSVENNTVNNNEQVINNEEVGVNNNQTQQEEPAEVITSDIDTSNWKTYRNEEYGFEVKYPNDWYLNDCLFNIPTDNSLDYNLSLSLSDTDSEYNCGPDGRIGISIVRSDLINQNKFKEYSNYEYQEKRYNNGIIIEQVSGYFESLGPEGEKRYCEPYIKVKNSIFEYKNNYYFKFYYNELFDVKDEDVCYSDFTIQKNYSGIYDVMLSSFRFVK